MENKQLRIPTEFNILGKTIKVEFKDDYCSGANIYGQANHPENTIYLTTRLQSRIIALENVEHTYLHEVVHHILQAMGETELNNSEKFVDLFSGILHQVLTTSKYGK